MTNWNRQHTWGKIAGLIAVLSMLIGVPLYNNKHATYTPYRCVHVTETDVSLGSGEMYATFRTPNPDKTGYQFIQGRIDDEQRKLLIPDNSYSFDLKKSPLSIHSYVVNLSECNGLDEKLD